MTLELTDMIITSSDSGEDSPMRTRPHGDITSPGNSSLRRRRTRPRTNAIELANPGGSAIVSLDQQMMMIQGSTPRIPPYGPFGNNI